VDAARETLAVVEANAAEYLCGGAFSLGDLNAAAAVMSAPLFLDMAAFPKTGKWLDRCLSRPAWARVAKYA
jgi:glutathione S-transferase